MLPTHEREVSLDEILNSKGIFLMDTSAGRDLDLSGNFYKDEVYPARLFSEISPQSLGLKLEEVERERQIALNTRARTLQEVVEETSWLEQLVVDKIQYLRRRIAGSRKHNGGHNLDPYNQEGQYDLPSETLMDRLAWDLERLTRILRQKTLTKHLKNADYLRILEIAEEVTIREGLKVDYAERHGRESIGKTRPDLHTDEKLVATSLAYLAHAPILGRVSILTGDSDIARISWATLEEMRKHPELKSFKEKMYTKALSVYFFTSGGVAKEVLNAIIV